MFRKKIGNSLVALGFGIFYSVVFSFIVRQSFGMALLIGFMIGIFAGLISFVAKKQRYLEISIFMGIILCFVTGFLHYEAFKVLIIWMYIVSSVGILIFETILWSLFVDFFLKRKEK